MRTRLAIAAAAVLFAACPPPSPGADSGTPEEDAGFDAGTDAGQPSRDAGVDAGFGPVAAADWCAQKARAACLRDLRCLRLSPSNFDACITAGQVGCDATGYARGVAEGRLAYDAGAAGECLDAYGRGSCDRLPANCEKLFVGLVPPDGGCLLPEECTAQGHCSTDYLACPQHCVAWLPRGGACDGWSRICAPTDGCDYVDAGVLGCVEGRDAGAACNYYWGCGANMTCQSGICVPLRAGRGEACGVYSGYYPYCEPGDFCRQPPPPSSGGTPPPGTCEPLGGLGATCYGYSSCLPALRCQGLVTTSTCAARAAVGETCSQAGDCQDQLYCDHATQKCAPLPGEGGDCTARGSSYTCAVNFWCDFSSLVGAYTCRAKRPLGEPCSYDSSCLSNHCEYGPLADGGNGSRCVAACSQRADAGL